MRRVISLSVMGVTIAAICLVATQVSPAVIAEGNGTVVKVDPANQTIPLPGENFTVDIRVDDVANLGAFQFDLVFDPAVVQFQSFTEGPFLKSSGRPTFCMSSDITAGTKRYGCASGGAQTGPDGSGVLVTVTFSPLTEAGSSVNLEQGGLYSPNADPIAATWQNGSVGVGQPPNPTAAPTLPSASSQGQDSQESTSTPVSSLMSSATASSGQLTPSSPAGQATLTPATAATAVSGATPSVATSAPPGSAGTGPTHSGNDSGTSGGIQWVLWGPIIAIGSVAGVALATIGSRLIVRRRTG
jgi:Cohesin domain